MRRAIILLVGLGLLVPAGARAATTGSITGIVTDLSGVPLEDVCVWVHDLHPETSSASDGTYVIENLEPGEYHVRFEDCRVEAGLPPRYSVEWFDDAPSEQTATPVLVDEATTTSGIDAMLAPWRPGTVRGLVRGDAGEPVGAFCVSAYDALERLMHTTATQASGEFWMRLNEGIYRLRAHNGDCHGLPDQDPLPYDGEWYDDGTDFSTATPVIVGAGEEVTRTFALAHHAGWGRITGALLGDDGDPAWHVCVAAFPEGTTEQTPMGTTTSRSDGSFVLHLPAGHYRVAFNHPACAGYRLHAPVTEWFDDAGSGSEASMVEVLDGVRTAGVSAELRYGTDVSVSRVSVHPSSGADLDGPRRIEVIVNAGGRGIGSRYRLSVSACARTSQRCSEIADRDGSLANPGDHTWVFDWDPRGFVGTLDVSAIVIGQRDPELGNNTVSSATTVLVDLMGIGI